MLSSGTRLAWHVDYFSLSWWAAAHITSHWASNQEVEKGECWSRLTGSFACAHVRGVCYSECVLVFVHACVEARGWHRVSSSIALYFILFWDKISHWSSSLGQTGWLVSPQHLPACTFQCWGDRCTPPHSSFTEPLLLHGRHFTHAISQPSPSPFFFTMRPQSIYDAIQIHSPFTMPSPGKLFWRHPHRHP